MKRAPSAQPKPVSQPKPISKSRPLAAAPRQNRDFVERFPALGRAWREARAAEASGPLDERARRLVKLGIAIGTRKPGPTHSAARKALAAGASPDALYQVVALAATSIGFPAAVAAFGWVRDVVAGGEPGGDEGAASERE